GWDYTGRGLRAAFDDALTHAFLVLAVFHHQIFLGADSTAFSFGAATVVTAAAAPEEASEQRTARQTKIFARLAVDLFGDLYRLHGGPANFMAAAICATVTNHHGVLRNRTNRQEAECGHGESKDE